LSVSEPCGNNTVYAYDDASIRISKTQAGVKTKYINDVAFSLVQVLMETSNTGTVQAIYNYGQGLISMNRSGVNSFYNYDGLGSTRQLTNSSGGVTASYTYDSWGNLIASSGTSANPDGFTGEQQFGEADNLVFLRARYYDPKVGRFISRDPIGYSDSINIYQYCSNNPINYTDPYGLGWREDFVDWLKAMIGKLCPGSWTVGGGEACLEGGTSCAAYKKALDNLMKDPDFIGDPNYCRLRRCAEIPAR
jgi:RHS repeat-associated protein